MKYALRIFYTCFLTGLLLSACQEAPKEGNANALTPTEGGRYYGGIFRLNESEYIKTLFPHNIVDAYSYRVASHIYEGLFKFDPVTLEITPSLAESYELDEAHTTYTVRLKKGVYFHDSPVFGGTGRELKAQDIKYCFSRACAFSSDNQAYYVFKDILSGAQEYFEATQKEDPAGLDFKGVEVVDDYTVKFKLQQPYPLFLHYLARPESWIFPKEAYEKYGKDMRIKAVGTGPFTLSSVDEDIKIILRRNENYHGKDEFGNTLPYLNAIEVQFIKDKRMEYFEFRKGNLDMMYRLPTQYILNITEETAQAKAEDKPVLDREPEMQTQMLLLNNQSNLFSDVNVRKAFAFAINRQEILDYVLEGEGYAPGMHGITAPSFEKQGYKIDDIVGYSYNPDSARYYLEKAGFPNGKGFPKISLYLNPDGDRHTLVATQTQKYLKDVLNVEIELNIVPHTQINERSRTGNFEMMRIAWVTDFPDPESFLRVFYSKYLPEKPGEDSYPNLARYKNPEFDALFEKALHASSEEEAYRLFKEAENLMMKDCPVLILWYDEAFRLIQPYVKNCPNNPMQYRDFSETYFVPHNKGAVKPTE